MRMEKDIVLDPGIRAIEVKNVVAGAVEDVVDEVDDGRRAIAAGEIDDIIIADGDPKEVTDKNSVTTGLDSAGTMHQLEPTGRIGKDTILNDEGGAIDMDVGGGGIAKGEVIEENRAAAHLDTWIL